MRNAVNGMLKGPPLCGPRSNQPHAKAAMAEKSGPTRFGQSLLQQVVTAQGQQTTRGFTCEALIAGPMKKVAWTVTFLLLGLAAYLSLWPVPVRAVSWKAPAAPGYTGAHAVNSNLAGLNLISLGAEAGPEHIVLAADGKLYAAVASGN